MIVYNVTSKIDWSIHDAWVKWMLEEHIPEVVATGCFTGAQLLKLLEIEEEDGPTYTAQYFAETKQLQEEYVTKHAATLRQKVFDKWGNRTIAFRSIMQVVQ
ncbi:MAG TPA: DUF4286 family protein [Lacibacter sp.]|jgi:hypothetical protein|nr:DUF4286 family protein [Lacibacter sp.]